MKKRIVFLLIVCLIMGSPLTALAARPNTPGPPENVVTPLYLNLGDSIAYGMSAEPGKSYFDQYADFLKKGPSMNLGVPGTTTGELLAALGTAEFQRAVARADIITISIGGNNLLRPIRESVAAAFGAAGLTPDLENPMKIKAAIAAIAAAKSAALGVVVTPEQVWQEITDKLITEASTGPTLLNAALISGVEAFVSDLPLILAAIHTMNPQATVIVFTLYNPVKPLESTVLYGLFELLAVRMNGLIASLRMSGDIHVLDVYNAFKMNPAAVAFSLAWDTLNLDPHPTTSGHSTIFGLLTDLGNIRAFQLGKPVFAGNPVSPAIAEIQGIAVADASASLPAAHGATGAEFGELVAQTAQEDPAFLADHASSQTAGLPAAHEDEEGNLLSGFGFGQAVSGLVREDPWALANHIRDR